MRDLTSLELFRFISAGWNLGNSLESINVYNGTYTGDETSWGNPVITRTLIDAVKAAGFNAVRIPCAWSHSIEDESTYRIRTAWKERVEEVVNYVLDNGMYAIINIHWDGGWMDRPTFASQAAINGKLAALWKQIAIWFRDYNDYLLFAGTNEVHVEGDYGTPSAENTEVQNSFNQTFVNTVRATGGRNAYRHLIVQAYNTNIEYATNYLTMPADTTSDRLMTEVHFYDPYDFALQEDGGYKTQWGSPFAGGDVSSWGQEDWVNYAFGLMKTNFIDKGIGVIVGEYGAILRSALTSGLQEHIRARNYYLEYVSKAARNNELVPFYWDNGNTGNNGFGLFDRYTGGIVYQDAVNAIIGS
jgi:endoglucanase